MCNQTNQFNAKAQPGAPLLRGKYLRLILPVGLACGAQMARGENQLDYRYEYYAEENDRMTIDTHSVYFEQKLIDSIIASGELVYDSISGATPVGTHDANGKAVTTEVWDIRRALNLNLAGHFWDQTLTPGFAYSKEHDYESYGISLNDAIEFNEKNTILQLGISHNFDSVRLADKTTWHGKDSTEGIIGISQLLTPRTVFSAAVTFGNDSGYLNDPYRLAEYQPSYLPFSIGIAENRPANRDKQIFFTSLTQHFDALNASIEGSYRFYHDSYEIFSHTAEVTWHQWLGKHVILEPFGRFYYQSAASFYSSQFTDPMPTYYSSDYRLSELYSFDLGIQATVIIYDHVRIIGGYHRYEMHGLGNTSSDMYPKANVFTVGISILW